MVAVGGAALGYAIAHRRLEDAFHERLQRELEDVREYYHEKYEAKLKRARTEKTVEGMADISDSEVEEIVDVAVKAAAAMTDYQGVKVEPDKLVENVARLFETPRVEEAAPEPEIEEEEVRQPHSAHPARVISYDQFVDNEDEFESHAFTYFAMDDVLANIEDKKVSKVERNAGLGWDIMTMLAEGRGLDQDILYVRNPHLKKMYEIARSEGSYEAEVQASDPLENTG